MQSQQPVVSPDGRNASRHQTVRSQKGGDRDQGIRVRTRRLSIEQKSRVVDYSERNSSVSSHRHFSNADSL